MSFRSYPRSVDDIRSTNDPLEVYHSTKASYLPSILEKGLLSDPPQRNYDTARLYKESRGRSVYFTTHPSTWGFDTIIKIQIPPSEFKHIHRDEEIGGHHFRFEGDIPLEWIKGHWSRSEWGRILATGK